MGKTLAPQGLTLKKRQVRLTLRFLQVSQQQQQQQQQQQHLLFKLGRF